MKKLTIVVLIMFLFLVMAACDTNKNESPTNVVHRFISYINDDNFSEAGQLLVPEVPWNPSAANTESDHPRIIIKSIAEKIIDDEAVVLVEYEEDPKPVFNSNPFHMTINLKKIEDRWLIYNMQ